MKFLVYFCLYKSTILSSLFNYFKFLIKSTNQHGVHSPFVYSMITKCFYRKTSEDISKELMGVIKKGINGNSSSLKKAKLYYRLIQYFNPKQILNIGTPEINAFTSALAASKITEVAYKSNLEKPNSNLSDYLGIKPFNQTEQQKTYDLVYFSHIDILNDQLPKEINAVKPLIHNDTLILLDGIHSSEKSFNIWENITRDEDFNVSIDTYHCGLLFIRKEQQKEHFIIRV
ncbi:hypothetical protein SAMN04487906_0610 [Zhouia amylolytica]|uniref:Methyltransferase domain-containing protein n=2 Tax=Zhouia amylolytica TaxID=376730 RepID=A0A1I6QED5_9FLAO|nr:hypothetical protein SAMN04487906_0610 [Zhouia amylolytica]